MHTGTQEPRAARRHLKPTQCEWGRLSAALEFYVDQHEPEFGDYVPTPEEDELLEFYRANQR